MVLSDLKRELFEDVSWRNKEHFFFRERQSEKECCKSQENALSLFQGISGICKAIMSFQFLVSNFWQLLLSIAKLHDMFSKAIGCGQVHVLDGMGPESLYREGASEWLRPGSAGELWDSLAQWDLCGLQGVLSSALRGRSAYTALWIPPCIFGSPTDFKEALHSHLLSLDNDMAQVDRADPPHPCLFSNCILGK